MVFARKYAKRRVGFSLQSPVDSAGCTYAREYHEVWDTLPLAVD